jgi:uncharacterized protein YgbK (DUF1537 family)
VNGVPLMNSFAAKDVLSPVQSSSILEIYKQQSRRKIAAVTCDTYSMGTSYFSSRIEALVSEGNKILVFDASSNEDINLIADTLILSRIKYVTVDPGPFTAAMYDKLRTMQKKESDTKLLLIVGSICPEIRSQMETLFRSREVITETIAACQLIESEKERATEINRATGALIKKSEDHQLLCLTSDGLQSGEKVLQLPGFEKSFGSRSPSTVIAESFGQAARQILQGCDSIHGLILSGGDIAAAVCQALHATGFQVMDEVLPLAIYGRLTGGIKDGLHLITKGGMVGNDETILTCVDYLLEKTNEKEWRMQWI